MDLPTLVDSNVYIDLLRSGLDPSEELTRNISTTDLATCGMIRVEVLRGVKMPVVRDRLAGFFDVLQNVPSDNLLWDETAMLAWKMDRCGQIIPATDLLIAACALRIGAVVLTSDAHFAGIPGLKVRWWPLE